MLFEDCDEHGLHDGLGLLPGEVRRFDDIDLGDEVEFKQGELDLAKQLIEQLANAKFEPEKYEDEYRQAVLLAVDRKVAGEEIVIVEEPDRREQIIDLVAALKQSLADKAEGAAPKRKMAKVEAGKTRKKKAAKVAAKKTPKKKAASK